MSTDRFGLESRAALLVLMAEGRAISNTEMKQRYGFTIVGQTSKTLTDKKLATKQKVGRAYVHELTDAGWAWCRQERAETPGPGGGAMGAAAYALLAAYFTLTENAPTAPRVDLASPQDLAQQIRDAYTKLADAPRAWVSLTELRPLLSAGKAEVDDALRHLLRDPAVTIVPESNQKTLTAEDRAAAVRIGSQDKHLIMIEA